VLFDVLDVPPVVTEDPFLSTLREGPNANDEVVAGSGDAPVVQRETESMRGFPTRGLRGEVAHIGPEILHDSGLVCGPDVGAGVIEGQRANGGVVRPEDRFKVERQPFQTVNSPLMESVSIRRPYYCPDNRVVLYPGLLPVAGSYGSKK
jgi:hypothetical protein